MESKGGYFSLKWSNFRSSFSEGFHDFLQEEAMVDVTLAVEGKFVQAHKLVLSVCSPYFKNLFKANPCKHPIVILKDVGHSDISYILEFMYKGEVGVKHEDLPSFLKLAETLRIKGLAGENIEQKNENHSEKNLDNNLARIRKKIERATDVDKEVTEFQSSSEQSPKKLLKSRKRRLSSKTDSVKKLKSEKCDVSDVRNGVSKDCDNLSEDEDSKPLLRFMRDSNVKFKKSSEQSESQCDNENESQCDNKTSFSRSDGFPDSEDSGGPDIHSMLQSDYSEETEETPQDACFIHTDLRLSPVWNYYDKIQNNMAVCRICRKILKGAQTTQAEYHLRAKHPYEASKFVRQKAEWLEKKKKMNSIFISGIA